MLGHFKFIPIVGNVLTSRDSLFFPGGGVLRGDLGAERAVLPLLLLHPHSRVREPAVSRGVLHSVPHKPHTHPAL